MRRWLIKVSYNDSSDELFGPLYSVKDKEPDTSFLREYAFRSKRAAKQFLEPLEDHFISNGIAYKEIELKPFRFSRLRNKTI